MTSAIRKLTAILAADVAGYSRLMGADEEGTLARLKAHRRELIDPAIAQHRGRIVKTTGDGMLVEFASVVDAVKCAVEIQRAMRERETELPPDKLIQFRIGVNTGDVIIDGDDIHGDGVNVAARLEALAEPGAICVSGGAWDQVRGKVQITANDLGEKQLKNIERAVRVYRITTEASLTERPALTLPDKPSIAVLPFQNMSGDPEQEYFSDGITEDIITALSRLRGFFVIARNSSFTYKGKPVDVRQIGRDLGIRYLVEGSVRKSGGRVRITAQLIECATANHLWAERYDRDLADIFAVQDEITESVVASIEPELHAAEDLRSRNKPPANLDAWDYVMRAIAHIGRFTAEDFQTAIGFLEQAIERDPRNARALALLAWTQARRALNSWSGDPMAIYPKALAIAKQAVALDHGDPWAYLALGNIEALSRRPTDAIAALVKAVELNPNFALAHGNLGSALAAAGRTNEAVEHIDRAIRMSPRDTNMHLFFLLQAAAHMCAGNYDKAAEWARKATRERPEMVVARRILVAALALTGDLQGARSELVALKQLQPEISLAWAEANASFGDAVRARFIEGLRVAGLE